MILSNVDIREFMASKDISIVKFSGELEPASYDLRIGDEATTNQGIINWCGPL